jgi:hypothetical protein
MVTQGAIESMARQTVGAWKTSLITALDLQKPRVIDLCGQGAQTALKLEEWRLLGCYTMWLL